jgi:small-conductance mechanosensitive channel
MDILLEGLVQEWHDILRLLPRILFSAFALLACVGAGRALGHAFVRLSERSKLSDTQKRFFRTTIIWLFALLGLIVALNLMGLKGLAASLVAGGGVTAVILGFAFREIGENFLAGFVLAFSSPFRVGDLIQSEDLQGEVHAIELRHTHIRTADGRDIFIPSAQILNRPLVNYTKDGLRRPSFTVGIDYGDDSEKAREILLREVRATSGVLETPPPSVTISNLASQYVELEVCFWLDTFDESATLPKVRTDAMEACRRSLVDLGYTVSSNVTTAVDIRGKSPLDLRLIDRISAS